MEVTSPAARTVNERAEHVAGNLTVLRPPQVFFQLVYTSYFCLLTMVFSLVYDIVEDVMRQQRGHESQLFSHFF